MGYNIKSTIKQNNTSPTDKPKPGEKQTKQQDYETIKNQVMENTRSFRGSSLSLDTNIPVNKVIKK